MARLVMTFDLKEVFKLDDKLYVEGQQNSFQAWMPPTNQFCLTKWEYALYVQHSVAQIQMRRLRAICTALQS